MLDKACDASKVANANVLASLSSAEHRLCLLKLDALDSVINIQCSGANHWSETMLYQALEKQQGYGVYQDAQLVAFMLITHVVDESELLNIVVDKTYRRQGLAALLMQAWQTLATSWHCQQLLLEVAANNDSAIALYQQSGFVQAGLRKGYYKRQNEAALDAMLMHKSLTANEIG